MEAEITKIESSNFYLNSDDFISLVIRKKEDAWIIKHKLLGRVSVDLKKTKICLDGQEINAIEISKAYCKIFDNFKLKCENELQDKKIPLHFKSEITINKNEYASCYFTNIFVNGNLSEKIPESIRYDRLE